MTPTPSASDAHRRRAPSTRLMRVVTALDRIESIFYVLVAVFLLVAGVLVITGTASDLVVGLRDGKPTLDVALSLIQEALLLVIVGELLLTLRLVLTGGQLSGEPFLLIGLVAAVRRVVVITAQVEGFAAGGRELTNFLLELGLLGLLTVAFAGALYLLRRTPAPAVLTDV